MSLIDVYRQRFSGAPEKGVFCGSFFEEPEKRNLSFPKILKRKFSCRFFEDPVEEVSCRFFEDPETGEMIYLT